MEDEGYISFARVPVELTRLWSGTHRHANQR